jgi:hypothetical protein
MRFRFVDRDGARSVQWKDRRLDSVCFPSLVSEGSFGFVDPRDVLRGCHMIPAFAGRKSHPDEVSISRSAHDGKDWNYYYVNQ